MTANWDVFIKETVKKNEPFVTSQDVSFNPYDDPEYAGAETEHEHQQWMKEQASFASGAGWHHPDCCCDRCYYGVLEERWLYNPSEY